MSSLPLILNNLAAVSTLAFGLVCLARPQPVARAVGFELRGPRGRAEFRIGFGGFFTGLLAYVLLMQQDILFTAVGCMWLGAAVSRIAVWFVDRPALNASYIGVFIYELAHALLLLA